MHEAAVNSPIVGNDARFLDHGWGVCKCNQFAPKNADLVWGIDAEAHVTAADIEQRDGDVLSDVDLLTSFAAEY
jgi:hypothetical protein